MGTVVQLRNQINNSYYQLKDSVDEKLVLVEEKIKSKLLSEVDLVQKMTEYHIDTGGKRLRALLTLGSAKLCGYTKGGRDINLAACVEMIHGATLMHDDVIDLGNIRRGKKTLNSIWGKLRPSSGKIDTFITRSSKNRQMMEVSSSKGKRAITNYKTIEIFENDKTPTLSLVECRLETGRTHQIRVHMTHMGNSIMGDGKYKKKYKKLKNIDTNLENLIHKLSRQFLHAQTLGFIHPKTNKEMIFTSILPQELENILLLLRNTGK